MSLEFGILRDGSTTTMIGSLRVVAEEDVFDSLGPLWKEIEMRTNESLDKYEGTQFKGESLGMLIALVESWVPPTMEAQEFLSELVRVAHEASASGRSLVYAGL